MIPSLRNAFNDQFSEEKYLQYLQQFKDAAPGQLDFRIAETPVFVPASFKNKMLDTCESIIDVIKDPEFKEITDRSIPEKYRMPGDNEHPEMLVFDFGVCKNEQGELAPQLIEMQGFPSLYAHQLMNDKYTRTYAHVPDSISSFLNGYQQDSYVELLRELIVGDMIPQEVVLLEVFPDKQKTRIDFHFTNSLLGIKILCITNLFAIGNQLYYQEGEEKIQIKRIFNRVIFDDLEQYDLPNLIDLKKEYDAEWIPHPHWFYRISKFTLPFLNHPNIPTTFFLNEMKQPVDLNEYVLKPLFSFAGMGVLIDVTQADIDAIPDPENWILQKKVAYAAVIETMDEPAKAEIRLFYFWKKGTDRPIAIHNLARLSKGKMIGTRYNQDKTWVGGTIAYFE